MANKLSFSIALNFITGSFKKGTAQVQKAFSEMKKGVFSMRSLESAGKGLGISLKNKVASGFNEVSIGIGSMIKGIIGAQAIIGGLRKVFDLFRNGIGSIIDFEASTSKLSAILGVTSADIKELTEDAKRLGAATKYTAAQATGLQIELAKLGFSKKEILDSTEYVLRFAQATGAELPEAAALAGAALRMYGEEAKESERYVSAMAVATTKSALSFTYLQTAMPIVGPVAKAFNFTIEDTLALLGKLADSGFDASTAATAARNILLNLADSNGKLAKSLGGSVRTLPELASGLQKLKEKGVDLNATLELTDKRSVAAFNAFLSGADKLVALRNAVTNVDGDLKNMAATMDDNVQGAIASLSSAWESFMLSFMKATGPAKDFLNWMASKIRSLAKDLNNPEQIINSLETDFNLLSKKDEKSQSEKLEKDYLARIDKLQEEGFDKEKAREMALIELQQKRKEITASDYRDLKIARREAESFTGAFQKQSLIKNAFSKMFGFKTDATKDADNAQLNYSKKYWEVSKKQNYNNAIDDLIEKLSRTTDVAVKPIDPVKSEALQKQEDAYAQSLRELNVLREVEKLSVDEYNKSYAELNKNALIKAMSSNDTSVTNSNFVDKLATEYSEAMQKIVASTSSEIMGSIQKEIEEEDFRVELTPIIGKRDSTFDYKASESDKISDNLNIWKKYRDDLQSAVNDGAEYLTTQLNSAIANVDSLESALKIAEVKEDIKSFSKELNESLYSGVKDIAISSDRMVSSFENLRDVFDDVDSSGWERIMAIWNAMTNTIDGILSICKTIETLTELTNKLAKAKEVEAAIDTATTATKVANKTTETTAEITALGTQTAAEVTASTAKTTAASTEMAAKSTAAYAYIPFAGPALAAAQITTMQALIAAAAIPKFAGGGIVVGGPSSGDRILARVNAGEMILNGRQQSNLFEAINSGKLNSMQNQSVSIGFDKVRGSDIYLSLKNYMKSTGKKL